MVRKTGCIRTYLQIANLFNTGYDEILNVRMPGRGLLKSIRPCSTPGCGPVPLAIGLGPFVRGRAGIDPEPALIVTTAGAAAEAEREVSRT
jgi:hypothetical protein